MRRTLYHWAALAGLALACSAGAKDPIKTAREANAAALAACAELEATRQNNAKLDAFCAEAQTHANTLERLEAITSIDVGGSGGADAGGGTGGAK